MQSKRQSWIETTSNTSIGFVGSWLITWTTLHLISNFAIATTVTTVGCTVWSLIRGYFVRRYFNKKHMTAPKHQPMTDKVKKDFQTYYVSHSGNWGGLHLVLGNGNVSNRNIAYCLDQAITAHDQLCIELCAHLLLMSTSQRNRLMAAAQSWQHWD